MRIRPEIKRVPPPVAASWYFTIDEAMAYLALSRVRIRELIDQNRLGEPAQCWGRLLIRKDCVERFDHGRVAAT
jgi:excisionase family DNA binding protein